MKATQQGEAWKPSVAVLDKPLVLNDAFCLNVRISTQETNQLTAVGMAMKLLSVMCLILRIAKTKPNQIGG